MLTLRNVTKVYSSKHGSSTKALCDVTLDFPDTGMVFLLGRSGSGKSTMLNIIGGLDTPTEGELIVDGRSSRTFWETDLDSYRNTYVGFVFQEYNLMDGYTVGRNVSLALDLQGRRGAAERVDDILRRVGLADRFGNTFARRYPGELSGGQKQRVAIARALVKDPKIILADEPTGALDFRTGEQLYELLKQLSADKLVIVVTHDEDAARKYGDRIIELADGEVASDTGPQPERDNGDGAAFVASRLPLRRTIAMGLAGFAARPIRLIVSVLLSVVALAAFGIVVTVATVNETDIILGSMYERDMRMLTVRGSYAEDTPEIVEEYTGVPPMRVYSPANMNIHISTDAYVPMDSFSLGLLCTGEIPYFAELDPDYGEGDARLTPDDRFEDASLCRLPEKEGEIAITDLHASMFMEFGYRGADGRITEISCPDDLIGKTLVRGTETGLDETVYTICGVYSTEIDREDVEAFDYIYNDEEEDYYASYYTEGIGYSIMSYAFVAKGESASDGVFGGMIKMSGDADRDAAFLHGLEYSEGGRNYEIRITTPISIFMSPPMAFRTYGAVPCAIVAAIMAVFSVLLMASSLTASLNMKSRKLGVLRALGAGKPDIFAICLVESVAVALLEMILTSAAVPLMCAAFNSIFYVSLLFFGVGAFFAVFGLCFGSAALSTVLPVAKLMRKKPVDIIAGR